VVVTAIHNGNSHRGALEAASGIEPGEAAAEYQDVRYFGPGPFTAHFSPLTG
jgi:hypothetical protein